MSGPAPAASPVSVASVENWSGKDRGDENFPVGSFLIRPALRAHVHAYYAYARNGDDIADDGSIQAAEKLARLATMRAVVLGEADQGSPSALRLRASLLQTGIAPARATDLLVAFAQDAVKDRYASWDELAEYCRYSAAPVGRYLLDLHGEGAAAHLGSDALCASLQVLNHVQDCTADLVKMDRCYLPQDLLDQQGARIADLRDPKCSLPLRRVLDSLLDRCDALNRTARSLPPACRSRGMRLEAAVIVGLAHRLARRLRREDPLEARVKLTRSDIAGACIAALRHL